MSNRMTQEYLQSRVERDFHIRPLEVRLPHSSDEANGSSCEQGGSKLCLGFSFLNSQRFKREAMKNLFHCFDRKNLEEGFRALDGSRARGIDNIRKEDYEKKLDQNIERLLVKLPNGSYVLSPKREVLIPKSNGKARPIAIACTEDKLVEKVMSNLLTSIYENTFLKCSYGFWPNLSCHHAINQAHKILLSKDGLYYVVEIDLANFFNTVNHRLLMKLVRKRIGSKKVES